MAQKFKLIGYDKDIVIESSYYHTIDKCIGQVFELDFDSSVLELDGLYFPIYGMELQEVFTIAQLQEQRGDLSAQISEMDYKWYEQLVIDDVMNLNDPKQFVMDLCEKLNIELEIIDERNDEER